MQELTDYLQHMQTDDVLAATETAKTQARILLEDQGIAAMALLFANLFADVIQNGTVETGTISMAKSSVRL